MVFSPRKASTATRALNAGVWFRLGLRIGTAPSLVGPSLVGMYSSPSTYDRVRKSRAISAVVGGVGCVVAQFDRSPIEPTAAVRAKRVVFCMTDSLGHICALLHFQLECT